MNVSKKAQAWSIDLIIGLLVFIMIIMIFYTLVGSKDESTIRDYSEKAELVASRLYEEGLVDADTGIFNDEKFLELASEDYDSLKERLGIVGEFCLFVETNDDPPQIKFISSESGEIWTGIGSSELQIGDFQCGVQWTP